MNKTSLKNGIKMQIKLTNVGPFWELEIKLGEVAHVDLDTGD